MRAFRKTKMRNQGKQGMPICSYGVQAFEFRDAFESDAEISELCSIEWLGILRRATFASHYTNAHEESKGKIKTK